MRQNKQLVFGAENGDCFRACITSILDVPNSLELPSSTGPSWLADWSNLLYDYGLSLNYETEACWRRGYWVAHVPSLNIEGSSHCIVMNGQKVAFDPSTKRQYEQGVSLLENYKIVRGGTYIEVLNPAKLPRYVEWVNLVRRLKT